ncbi:MAG: methyltransferase domain-containing protein [Kamptonema sp. SIO4C4]|nr:methyltransferase domain-containing protein [Kamptonema sp. SIO4C4]
MKHLSLPTGIQQWLASVFRDSPLNVQIECAGHPLLSIEGTTQTPSSLLLQIHHPGVLRTLLLNRDPLVLSEAYLQGYFDFQGRVEDMILLGRYLGSRVKQSQQALTAWLQALTLPRLPSKQQIGNWLQQWGNHTLERDRESIQQHYDVGNDFYKLWLDPLLVYSCAHFPTPDASLAAAQEHKLDLTCRKLKLQPNDTLLDIGCGWGALLRWAVKHYGVKGYGITLSQEQVNFNQECIEAEGLGDRLQVELRDYRNLPKRPTFDKIVSVGMIEHVGLENYPIYFQSALNALKPGGLFLNHGINSSEKWDQSSVGERFINRYIFPNGELARLSATLTAAEEAGWEIVDVDAWRIHYAKTLRHWANNLAQQAEQASQLIGERKLQIWQLYLLGSAMAFEDNQMGVNQTLLRKRADTQWNLPLTREWLV